MCSSLHSYDASVPLFCSVFTSDAWMWSSLLRFEQLSKLMTFFYVTFSELRQALTLLESANGALALWLRWLELSVSIPKCQLCLFMKFWVDPSSVSLEIGDVEIPCRSTFKYLGVILKPCLSWSLYITCISGKALRAMSVYKVLSSIS